MDILKGLLNSPDIHLLFYFGIFLVVMIWVYQKSMKQQKVAIEKVNISLKLQEHANHQLGLVVGELRRANRLLTELGDLEPLEPYSDRDNMTSKTMTQSYAPSSSAAHSQNEASAASAGDGYKLYVGNIDYAATEAELGDYFAQYGQVEFVNIPVNRYTGKARGFGFVSFVSKNDAERAMVLHGSEFKGRQIQVNFAKERDFG